MTLLEVMTQDKTSKRIKKGVFAALYRVSTELQDLGLQAQKDAVHKFATANGLLIEVEVIEAGVSGGCELGERQKLVELLEYVRTNKLAGIIVHRLDRVSRNQNVSNFVDYYLGRSGASVLAVEGGVDASNPFANVIKSIQVAIAVEEKKLIQARTKAALQVKKANSERISGIAEFGFKFEGDKVVANEEEQRVIELVRKLMSEGKGSSAIAKELSKRGVLNRNGRAFSQPVVWKLMKKIEG